MQYTLYTVFYFKESNDLIECCRYYSATIIQMSGVQNDQMAIWLAAATAFTNFLFTLVGVWLVERVGRRKLTLGSILGEDSKTQP